MSATMSPSVNGRVKKSLAFQLDRLDSILDGLADALNSAVSDAVRETVGQAARDAVRVALEEAVQQARSQPEQGFWHKVKSRVGGIVTSVTNCLKAGYRKVQQWGTRTISASALAIQAGLATIRSRSLRMGMFLGALSSCAIGLFRKDAKSIWWGAGILVSALLMGSLFNSWGMLLFGGGVLSLMLVRGAWQHTQEIV